MKSEEIRKRFLEFFEKRGHKIVSGSSLIPPSDDKSSLFISAGVQPLAPYILGKPHPLGKRIVNIQKCVRVQDIDEVGDNTHDTFFEMMGNWSFGDYFKEDSIKWSYELLTSKIEDGGMGLDPKRLYITVFGGNKDKDAPKDEESFEIWKKVGIPENRIYFMTWNGKKDPNWWEVGDNGPCGPDTEIFYDITKDGLDDMTKEEYLEADNKQQVIEIWNNVFMQYEKKDGKIVGKLEKPSVDTGAGLERWAMALQGKDNIFETDLFAPIMSSIIEIVGDKPIDKIRIIADHLRTITFMIVDGVGLSNTGRGYILRRLIRRAMLTHRKFMGAGLDTNFYKNPTETVINFYQNAYHELNNKRKVIIDEIGKEVEKFSKTLDQGLKQFNTMIRSFTDGKLINQELPASIAFDLVTTYGFPFELVEEEARELGMTIDKYKFESRMEAHRIKSKAGMERKFKGGLGGHSEMEVKYHTATHLLHQSLRDVLGDHVEQKGSNITPERLRFDFSHSNKMTDEEKQKVEETVNKKIAENLPVNNIVLPKEEALKIGALRFFGEKYGDQVSVYYIGNSLKDAYSKEFCGGPHVSNIGILGNFKITKEEAVSVGTRRIKATLQ